MAQSLGTLFVDLQANTGGFVSALSKAAYTAQKASKEMSKSFRDLGEVASQTFGAFGDFNPAVSKLSFALETAGRAASSAVKEFSALGASVAGGAALASIAGLAAGAVIGLALVDGIIVSIAAHAAEGAAKMFELSQSTGVPVGTLSGLGFAAKAAGVDVETLATGLERMNKSAFAAATAPAGASNAYTRLGISLREVNGNIRPTQSLLLDLADKFSKIPDGVEKTADAIQIFGRGGAALIPFLNEGKSSIAEIVDYAERVGAVLSGTAAAGAHEFERSLSLIGVAVQGAENRLTADLLPALQTVVQALVRVGADGQPAIVTLVDSLAFLVKLSLDAGATFVELADQIGGVLLFIGEEAGALVYALGADIQALSQALVLDFSGAKKSMADGTAAVERIANEFIDRGKSSWKSYGDFINSINGTLKPPDPFFGGFRPGELGARSTPAPSGPTASGRPDVVGELVAKLQTQAAAELELASATEKSAAASVLAKSAAEAETKIGETLASLLAQQKSLRKQLVDAKAEEAAGESSGGKRARSIEAEIAGVQKMLAELQKDAPQIRALYAEIGSGQFAAKAAKDLEEFTGKTKEETEAAQNMAAAFSKGGLAVQDALDAAKIAPFEEKLSDLGELIGRLKQASIPTGPVGSVSAVGSLFGNLQQSYDQLAGAIGRAKTAVASSNVAKIGETIAEEKNELKSEAEAYGVLAKAALKSAEAQREAAAQAATIRFSAKKENLLATPEELKGVSANELEKQNQDQTLTIARASVQFDPAAGFAQEIEKLQEIKSFLESAGESTIAIDTAIYQARIQHIEDYQRRAFEAQNEELLGQEKIYEGAIQTTEQWDRAAEKVGTLGERFRAIANEIQLEGQETGGKIFSEFQNGIDDLAGTVAKFAVTGKTSFSSLFASIAEGLIKLEVQFAISKIFKLFTGGIKNQPQTAASGLPGIPSGGPSQSAAGGASTFAGSIAKIFGINVPGSAGAAAGQGLPSSVASITIAAQIVNVNGGISTSGGPTQSGFPGIPTGGSSDGSSGSPFTSIIADSSGNPFDTSNTVPISLPAGGSSSPADSSGQLFSSLLSSSGGLGNIFSSSSASSAGGGLSDLFSLGGDAASAGAGAADAGSSLLDILPDFFLADGGRVSQGTPYIVGERNAEVFVPDQAGRIIPSIGQFVNSSASRVISPGSGSGFGGNAYHAELHIHGVTDADSFRSSQGQILAELGRTIDESVYRNRGGRSRS